MHGHFPEIALPNFSDASRSKIITSLLVASAHLFLKFLRFCRVNLDRPSFCSVLWTKNLRMFGISTGSGNVNFSRQHCFKIATSMTSVWDSNCDKPSCSLHTTTQNMHPRHLQSKMQCRFCGGCGVSRGQTCQWFLQRLDTLHFWEPIWSCPVLDDSVCGLDQSRSPARPLAVSWEQCTSANGVWRPLSYQKELSSSPLMRMLDKEHRSQISPP